VFRTREGDPQQTLPHGLQAREVSNQRKGRRFEPTRWVPRRRGRKKWLENSVVAKGRLKAEVLSGVDRK